MDYYESVWSMYFASITSFQYHPGNPSIGRLSLEECAEIADKMVKLQHERFQKWPGSQQSEQ